MSAIPQNQSQSIEDIEIDLLLEGIYRLYGFDFRNYALSSLRRRLRDVIDRRPLVKDPLDLERIYQERDAVYRKVADHEVAADDDAQSVAMAVVEVVT